MGRLGVIHFVFDASRILGLRDRLRCPSCGAVGTWKPHGGIFDKEDVLKIRRWLCKWCGFYDGPADGLPKRRVVNPGNGHWDNTVNFPAGITPADAIAKSEIAKAWPWRG